MPTFDPEISSNSSMPTGKWRTTIACSMVLTVVVAVPGLAQSNNRSWFESAASSPDRPVIHAYSRGPDFHEQRSAPPPNLTFSRIYRDVIHMMLERSTTFRRQCLRLRNAPHVRVHIQTLHPQYAAQVRARAEISRDDQGMLALVQVRAGLPDLPELIAHELEHIIEQIDGVDLRGRAALTNTGVRASANGSYETMRAIRTGELVAWETRRFR